MHIAINRNSVNEYLMVVGFIITICCAAIGALFVNFFGEETSPGWLVKGAGLFFIISVLFLTISSKIFIEHKEAVNNYIHGGKALVIYCGVVSFFIAIAFLVFGIF